MTRPLYSSLIGGYGAADVYGQVNVTPVHNKQAETQPVSFQLLRAGVTEFITADGLVCSLRIKVNRIGVDGRKNDDGTPVYVLDAEIEALPIKHAFSDDTSREALLNPLVLYRAPGTFEG